MNQFRTSLTCCIWTAVALMTAAGWFLPSAASGKEVPDIRTVEPDLVVPEMVEGDPGPGKRVKQTTAGWEDTQVYHALYLPVDWQPKKQYPVIVEYAGNGPFTSPYGDVSTGKVEGSCMGYGISGGKSKSKSKSKGSGKAPG